MVHVGCLVLVEVGLKRLVLGMAEGIEVFRVLEALVNNLGYILTRCERQSSPWRRGSSGEECLFTCFMAGEPMLDSLDVLPLP